MRSVVGIARGRIGRVVVGCLEEILLDKGKGNDWEERRVGQT